MSTACSIYAHRIKAFCIKTSSAIVYLVLSILIATPLCLATEMPTSVRYIDSEKNWPFTFESQGEFQGVQPEIVRLIFESFNIQMSERWVPDARLLFEIQKKHADVTIVFTYGGLSIDAYPEFVQVCSKPVYDLSVDALWLESTPIAAHEFKDLSPYRIGTLNSAPGLLEQAGFNLPSIHYFNSSDALVKSLLTGRVDVVVMNWRHAQALIYRLKVEQRIERGLKLQQLNLHLAIAKHWAPEQQRNRLCERAETLRRQDKFTSIVQSYLPASP